MTDSLTAYRDALASYTEAERKVNEVTNLVSGVAEALKRDPKTFFFSNAGPMPAEVVLSRVSPFDGSKWPTASEIQGLLLKWHDASMAMRNAWNAIPAAERDILQPPSLAVSQRSRVPV